MNLKKLYFSVFSFIAYTSYVDTMPEIPLLNEAVGLKMSRSTLDDKLENLKNRRCDLNDKLIKEHFSDEDICKISDKVLDNEDCWDDQSVFLMHVASLGGNAYAQQEYSRYFILSRKFNDGAYWFIESAKNGNLDILSSLSNENLYELTDMNALKNIQSESLRNKLVHHWQTIYNE